MSKKLQFCTLFNSSYLSRGLALYDSLMRNCNSFHLYIYAFDDVTFTHLKTLGLRNVTIISLLEFEDPELLGIKDSRSIAEYCWTCTPSVIKYSIEKHGLDHCIYLDADIFFFSDPRDVLESFLASKNSVLITPHNYTSIYEQSKTSGIYCVQFMPFKNDVNGMKVLNWWREKCIEWCYHRLEDGKLGDQMYLDSWPVSFKGIRVEEFLGIGVAPWNVQRLKLLESNNLSFKSAEQNGEVIFYHFHALKIHKDFSFSCGNYLISTEVKRLIYKPYIKCLKENESTFKLGGLNLDVHSFQKKTEFKFYLKHKLKTFADCIKLRFVAP